LKLAQQEWDIYLPRGNSVDSVAMPSKGKGRDHRLKPGKQKRLLTEKDRDQVKHIAHELLEKLKEVLVIDRKKKQRTKARVENLIKDVLDALPEVDTDELWPKACEGVYLHVFDKYVGEGVSVYNG